MIARHASATAHIARVVTRTQCLDVLLRAHNILTFCARALHTYTASKCARLLLLPFRCDCSVIAGVIVR